MCKKKGCVFVIFRRTQKTLLLAKKKKTSFFAVFDIPSSLNALTYCSAIRRPEIIIDIISSLHTHTHIYISKQKHVPVVSSPTSSHFHLLFLFAIFTLTDSIAPTNLVDCIRELQVYKNVSLEDCEGSKLRNFSTENNKRSTFSSYSCITDVLHKTVIT